MSEMLANRLHVEYGHLMNLESEVIFAAGDDPTDVYEPVFEEVSAAMKCLARALQKLGALVSDEDRLTEELIELDDEEGP